MVFRNHFLELSYFSRMIRMVLLGSGNVATHFYNALRLSPEVTIIQTYNRKKIKLHSSQSPDEITDQLNHLVEADVYLLAISDEAIERISAQLPFTNKLVLHTSGGIAMKSLAPANRRGVLYPLQSFSKHKEMEYENIPICVEAEYVKDLSILQKIAQEISSEVYEISSEQRTYLHIAAVFVNNFSNHLFTIGKNICDTHHIPFEILSPLIVETAEKAIQLSPEKAQTGPASRGDSKTIIKHLEHLQNESYKKIYTLITNEIQSHYGKKL